MRLLKEELKKIWRPLMALAVLVVGLLFYLLFANTYIRYFINGEAFRAEFDISREWVEKYGPTIEPEELEQIKLQREEEAAEFAEQVVKIDGAAERGITSYEDYLDWENKYYTGTIRLEGVGLETGEQFTVEGGNVMFADMEQERFLWTVKELTNYYRLPVLDRFFQRYEDVEDGMLLKTVENELDPEPASREIMLARAAEVQETENLRRGYLPQTVTNSVFDLFNVMTIWCVLSVILLLSPTLVRERVCRMRGTQWAGKTGRGVLKRQMLAALLSALLLTLLNLTVYFALILSRGILPFWDFPLFSVSAFELPWFNWTFGQYLAALALLILLVSLAAALGTVFLSHISKSNIGILLKSLPLFVALSLIISRYLREPFFFTNFLSRKLGVIGAEWWCAAILLAIGIELCVGAVVKQRKAELLS